MSIFLIIADNFVVSALYPFNPFGVDLFVADGTMEFISKQIWPRDHDYITSGSESTYNFGGSTTTVALLPYCWT